MKIVPIIHIEPDYKSENAQLAPTGTSLWRTDYYAFGPRVGLAYVFRQSSSHQTVVRSGYGIFYDMGNA